MRVFTDDLADSVSERVDCGFFVPSLGYRFGLRLPVFTSILSPELYFMFFALKYILRMKISVSAVFSNSFLALTSVRDRFSTHAGPSFAHKIVHLIFLISDFGLRVMLIWIFSHVGIPDNEIADSITRSASRLPMVVRCEVSRDHLFLAHRRDFNALLSRSFI